MGQSRAPRFEPPLWLLRLLAGVVEVVCSVLRKPPPVTRSVLQIVHRYAWYDTMLARTELGWVRRPLRQTLEDTIHWLREHEAKPAKRGATVL